MLKPFLIRTNTNTSYNMTESPSCYYQLSLSNVAIENAKDHDTSTASHMQLILENEELDLNDQIYMKSLAAEVCLENFSLSNLPSTFCGTEFIDYQLTVPDNLTKGNAIVTRLITTKRNNTNCKIPLPALITSTPQTAIDHLNLTIRANINKFLLLRYMEIVCDTDLFQTNSLEHPYILKEEEISLLLWYLLVAVVTRLQLLALINEKIGFKGEMPSWKHWSNVTFSKATEQTIIESSSFLKSITDRKTVARHLLSFSEFYDIKLESLASINGDKLVNLASHLNTFLVKMGFLTTVDSKVTDESISILNTIRDNNISILHEAEICFNILKLEQQKLDSVNGQGLTEFVHNDALRLSLDRLGKCRFDLYPELFLALDGTQFCVYFGPSTARVLGVVSTSSDPQTLQIGPLTNPTNSSNDQHRSKLKSNIISSSYDRLFSRVTPMPSALFVLSDMISNDCHYTSAWMSNSAFPDYQILAAYSISSSDLESRSIVRLFQPKRFFRVKRSQNILRKVNLIICDQHFRRLHFIQKTYCHFSLCLRPANLNI